MSKIIDYWKDGRLRFETSFDQNFNFHGIRKRIYFNGSLEFINYKHGVPDGIQVETKLPSTDEAMNCFPKFYKK